MKKEIEFDEETYFSAKNILQDEGLDINVAINMFLKKLVKENTLGFLFNRNLNAESSVQQQEDVKNNFAINRMTKSIAKRLFYDKGINVSNNYFFASENSSTHIFWANIHYDILTQVWSLILNDKSKKLLHLFAIPANKFKRQDFVMRADKPEIIDLQIAYNDPTFTDNRSGISFNKYLIDTIKY